MLKTCIWSSKNGTKVIKNSYEWGAGHDLKDVQYDDWKLYIRIEISFSDRDSNPHNEINAKYGFWHNQSHDETLLLRSEVLPLWMNLSLSSDKRDNRTFDRRLYIPENLGNSLVLILTQQLWQGLCHIDCRKAKIFCVYISSWIICGAWTKQRWKKNNIKILYLCLHTTFGTR